MHSVAGEEGCWMVLCDGGAVGPRVYEHEPEPEPDAAAAPHVAAQC